MKEAIHDVFRISILFGLEQDGRPLNSDLLFETFIPEGTDDDPYVNRYEIIDDEGRCCRCLRSWLNPRMTGY